MNWEAVIENLREQANDAVTKAEAIRAKQPFATSLSAETSAGPTTGGGYQEQLISDRWRTIERHRIHANFCFGLAEALEAGLKP